MQRQHYGRIVNIASESGIQPDPFMPHYNAAKAAIINLTKSLSKAYARDGILVNAVSPAMTRTEIVEGMLREQAQARGVSAEEATAAFLKELRPNIVLGRPADPAEVAWCSSPRRRPRSSPAPTTASTVGRWRACDPAGQR